MASSRGGFSLDETDETEADVSVSTRPTVLPPSNSRIAPQIVNASSLPMDSPRMLAEVLRAVAGHGADYQKSVECCRAISFAAHAKLIGQQEKQALLELVKASKFDEAMATLRSTPGFPQDPLALAPFSDAQQVVSQLRQRFGCGFRDHSRADPF